MTGPLLRRLFWASCATAPTLFPCARADGDVLRLQWPGPQIEDVSAIQCAPAHGMAMKAWVLGERERWMTGATG